MNLAFKSFWLCISLFFVMNTSAQNKNFEKQWATIDSLIEKENLTKSAIKKVDELYTTAKQQQQQAHVIKALIYKLNLQNIVTENIENKGIQLLEAEIKNTENPVAKSILQAILAKHYTQYFNNNSWRIKQRKNTNEVANNDINLWTSDDFYNSITQLWTKILQPTTLLQQTDISTYKPLIKYGKQKHLRNNIYDLLAYEALSFYEPTSIGEYKSSLLNTNIKNKNALASIDIFLKTSFDKETKNIATILSIYQNIINFYKKDKLADALIDANLLRIQWAYEHLSFDKKDKEYLNALNEIIDNYSSNALYSNYQNLSYKAMYYKAVYYSNKADNYTPKSTDSVSKNGYGTALKIINTALASIDKKNNAYFNLFALKQTITQAQLNGNIEAVNLPQLPFRALISYKNIDTLYYRIIKLAKPRVLDENDEYEDINWSKIVKKQTITASSVQLPNLNDFREHKTEIKIDALPIGYYALVASNTANFDVKNDNIFYLAFGVSNLSYVQHSDNVFVLNRNTGEPIPNASVTVKQEIWNGAKNAYEQKVIAVLTSNTNGQVTLPADKYNLNNGYKFDISLGKDYLPSTTTQYYYKAVNEASRLTREQELSNNASVKIFTDRSIYRPTQTVQFKGIITTALPAQDYYHIYTNLKTITVMLTGAQGKLIDSVNLAVNEFGSFNGSFKIPQNVLTGTFNITTKAVWGSTPIKVEEYKRPTFFVEAQKQKSTYKLGDNIIVKATAKAYAGNTINAAKVNYTVTRKANFDYWFSYDYYRTYMPNTQATIITSGETLTNDKGEFEIPFKALADSSINANAKPMYHFDIKAVVTDLNGENRELSTNISVAAYSFFIQNNLPTKADINTFNKINIETKNIAGEKINKEINLQVYSLQMPERLIRERLWEKPDAFVMDKNTYIQHFPTDEYNDETNKTTWANKEKVLDKIFDIKIDAENNFSINNNLFKPGVYKFVFTGKETSGEDITLTQWVELYNEHTMLSAIPTFNQFKLNKTAYNKGDTATFQLYTDAKNIYLIKNITTSNTTINQPTYQDHFEVEKINQALSSFKTILPTSPQQNTGIYYAFVYNNRLYTSGTVLPIKTQDNNLTITYGTFRNKTLPGSKEDYTVTISNSNKDTIKDAELLATMYDASLDAIYQHSYSIPYTPMSSAYISNKFSSSTFKSTYAQVSVPYIESSYTDESNWYNKLKIDVNQYNLSNGWGGHIGYSKGRADERMMEMRAAPMALEKDKSSDDVVVTSYATKVKRVINYAISQEGTKADSIIAPPSSNTTDENNNNNTPVQIRKNFNETAVFLPNIYANKNGEYSFTVTLPDALTKWKIMNFAHTKDLHYGIATQTIIAQKPLMVQPNMPRFLVEGDRIELVTKLANTGDQELTGQCSLELINAQTGVPVDGWFNNVFPTQYFTVAAGVSSMVKFPIQIPVGFTGGLTYRIIATAHAKDTTNHAAVVKLSDGEENTLPVLTHKILVTQALPLYLRSNQNSNSYYFTALKEVLQNNTAVTQNVAIEYTNNTAATVLQALPYLMQYPHECAEQTFNKFFANSIAAHVVTHNKAISSFVNKYKNDTTLLQSKLQQNPELKAVLLQNTPWVLDAENEEQQHKNLALLLDETKVNEALKTLVTKLIDMQLPSGGFAWFKGGREDVYITQYILTGIGKLQQKNLVNNNYKNDIKTIVDKALPYIDAYMKKAFDEWLLGQKKSKQKYTAISPVHNYYWYMRSYFASTNTTSIPNDYFKYYVKDVASNFKKYGIYSQALAAVTLHQFNSLIKTEVDKNLPIKILKGIEENAVEDTAKGSLYFKNNNLGYYWYQNNIETHTLLIEAYSKIFNNPQAVQQLKTWLLLNKQANSWSSTISTAAACYAMLFYGNNWLQNAEHQQTSITVGKQTFNTNTNNALGYIKHSFDKKQIDESMANINVQRIGSNANGTDNQPTYGAMYIQYLQDASAVSASDKNLPLSITKKIFKEEIVNGTKILTAITNDNELKIGDKLTVRVEIKCDRPMEYLHLKDMRAAAAEPVDILSSYKWQDGLGYYQSTQDAATNFFISYMPKGSYVFDYAMYVTHAGKFTAGIASIQCMYAPEFVANSKGFSLNIK